MMGGNQGQNKQNIFGQPGQTAQGGNTNNDVASDAVKTSAAGDVGTGGQTLAGPANAPTVQDTGGGSQPAQKTAQAAFAANRGKVKAPDTFKNLQTQIGTAQTGLEKQAADYAAAQAASHNYALDQSVAQKAVEDNAATEERGKVSGLIGRGMAEPIENFNPTGVAVNTDLLNTPAGIKELVGQGRRPTYNSGMAAFDAMLLQQDPAFQAQVAQTKAQNAELKKNVANTIDTSEAAANAAAAQNLKTSQEDLKNYLLGYQGNITEEEKNAAAAANAALPGQIDAIRAQVLNDLITSQKKKAQAALDAQFQPGRATAQLNAVQVDPSQYVDFLKGYDPTGSQFVTQTQAERFNRIASLLGQGGATQVAAGELPGLYTTRANDLYNSLVGQATEARQAQDTKNQAQINDIIAAAQRSAEADNARRLALTNSYGSDVQKIANQLLGQSQSGLAGNVFTQAGYTPEMKQTLLNRITGDYLKNNPVAAFGTSGNAKLGGNEVLTADQANQLNALARDTGMPATYQAGQYASGTPQSFVNQSAIQNALLNYIKQVKFEQAPNATNPAYAQSVLPNPNDQPILVLPGQKKDITTTPGGGILGNQYSNIKSNAVR